ncbi:MAG: FlgD immunoglobulin-like domain containing protein, partial [Candidatus Krumholzibacteriia bacterium]
AGSASGAVIDDLRLDDIMLITTPAPELPLTTLILGCAPNPFNPRTVLRYTVPAAGPVRLDVFDVRGRRVSRLVDRIQPAGQHEVTWAGQADDGRAVASGVYLARLRAAGSEDTHRLVLMK